MAVHHCRDSLFRKRQVGDVAAAFRRHPTVPLDGLQNLFALQIIVRLNVTHDAGTVPQIAFEKEEVVMPCFCLKSNSNIRAPSPPKEAGSGQWSVVP